VGSANNASFIVLTDNQRLVDTKTALHLIQKQCRFAINSRS
jgi:hypothetical protein